ncbi:MAG: dTMP kinase [Pseudomonadota bacterium]
MSRGGRGCFITLEGIEGAGKSTQQTYLADYLRARGREVVVTREPGGTALGERVRAIFLDPALPDTGVDSELLLIYAARAQHLHELILPSLARGAVVLCDRFEDSTYAYQGGGRGVPAARIEVLSNWLLQGLQPDLTLWLDVEPELGLARAGRRSAQDRLEQETVAFFTRARAIFAARAAASPARIVRIDADADREQVSRQLLAAVQERLRL